MDLNDNSQQLPSKSGKETFINIQNGDLNESNGINDKHENKVYTLSMSGYSDNNVHIFSLCFCQTKSY